MRLSISTGAALVNFAVFSLTTSAKRGGDTIRILAAATCQRRRPAIEFDSSNIICCFSRCVSLTRMREAACKSLASAGQEAQFHKLFGARPHHVADISVHRPFPPLLALPTARKRVAAKSLSSLCLPRVFFPQCRTETASSNLATYITRTVPLASLLRPSCVPEFTMPKGLQSDGSSPALTLPSGTPAALRGLRKRRQVLA